MICSLWPICFVVRGFGATRDELEGYIAKGYEATVEELLNPESAPEGLEDEDLVRRYHVGENSLMYLEDAQSYWMYRMVHTQRPLEEKMALFLARCIRHGLHQAEPAQSDPQPDPDVPPLWDGQLP